MNLRQYLGYILQKVYSLLPKKNKKEGIPDSVEIIDSHLDDFFDDDANIVVFHELVSEVIHRDIYFIKATKDSPFHTLLSCGMSALPMYVPKDIESSEYAEIVFLLPEEWNLNYEAFDDERNYWPIRVMKELMILPQSNKTWLGFGHTYSHEDGEEFAEGIGFNSVMLAYSTELSEDFTQIKLQDNKQISIYTLIPLYPEELKFKMENCANDLLERFDEFGIQEIVEIGRKNVCL